jgi:hypothetical protein
MESNNVFADFSNEIEVDGSRTAGAYLRAAATA